jgi:pimeloyl-ACP methyl ester carboxylesterase
MAKFRSDGVDIRYEIEGTGDPVLLIHGFASTARVNWIDTGWVDALVRAGFRAIAFDNRGHGLSGKLYEPEAYEAPIMAEDARRLLDHLAIRQAHILGYSMGARIAALLAIAHPERVRSLVLAGLAGNLISGIAGGDEVVRALEATSRNDVREPGARAFRIFAEQMGSDLKALAACMRSQRQIIPAGELGRITAPVLIVAGELDDIAGPIDPLLRAIAGSRGLVLPRRNHMSAVGDKLFKQAAIDFFRAVKAP